MFLLVTILLLGFYTIFTLIVFVIGVTPTDVWNNIGRKISAMRDDMRAGDASRALARATRGRQFQADKSFVPQGVGLAVDLTHRLVFAAGTRAGRDGAVLVPLDAIRGHASGISRGDGFEDAYVELILADGAAPWRISCGNRPEVAREITRALDELAVGAGSPS